tara:strand:- start:74 stop:358 length:285 start_codon:yes stop_codon:yes gene_type:complete
MIIKKVNQILKAIELLKNHGFSIIDLEGNLITKFQDNEKENNYTNFYNTTKKLHYMQRDNKAILFFDNIVKDGRAKDVSCLFENKPTNQKENND